jgi:hypothetical protein
LEAAPGRKLSLANKEQSVSRPFNQKDLCDSSDLFTRNPDVHDKWETTRAYYLKPIFAHFKVAELEGPSFA